MPWTCSVARQALNTSKTSRTRRHLDAASAPGLSARPRQSKNLRTPPCLDRYRRSSFRRLSGERSEEHTSELQSHLNLVCRLLLEKKKKKIHLSYHQTRRAVSM